MKTIRSVLFKKIKGRWVILILFCVLLSLFLVPMFFGDYGPPQIVDYDGCFNSINILVKELHKYAEKNGSFPFVPDNSGKAFTKLLFAANRFKHEKIGCPGYMRWKQLTKNELQLYDCYVFMNLSKSDWQKLKSIKTEKREGLIDKLGFPLVWDKYSENHVGLYIMMGAENDVQDLRHREFDGYMDSVKKIIEEKLGRSFDSCITH